MVVLTIAATQRFSSVRFRGPASADRAIRIRDMWRRTTRKRSHERRSGITPNDLTGPAAHGAAVWVYRAGDVGGRAGARADRQFLQLVGLHRPDRTGCV